MSIEVGIVRCGAALVVAGAVAVLGGCTSTSEPVVSPSVSVSAVVTPSPSPTLSHEEQMLALIPEEAKGDDLFAAEAMAKFFISLHPGMYQKGDTALWEFLCLPESLYCSTSVESARSKIESGEVQHGGEIRIPDQLTEMAIDVDAAVPTAFIGLQVEQTALTVHGPDGELLADKDPVEFDVAFRLIHSDGLWRVSGVEVARSNAE